ncbi:MAG TPA: multicopper oxidase domain-containing protein, partial [Gemmatimonadales bacterium]|nr:multicopper oxidase domain-containing protein [Gemmatimonadales bacterium]
HAAACLLLSLACGPASNTAAPGAGSDPAQARAAGAQAPDQHPDTLNPPADVSHGEARVGGTDAPPAPIEAALAPAERGRVRRLRIEITHTDVTIAPGVTYAAWTFGNRVPGPALHVRQGDTVDFTLVNKAPIPHSLDFHAAEIAPDKYYRNLLPNDSLQYRFVARVPGAFLYHCGTAPVAMHIANGMYGALVVDPAEGRPKAKEFVFVQSEFYLSGAKDKNGVANVDWQKVLGLAPDHVAFNGRASQYAEHPLEVRPGELLRLYVVNAGPNRISSFHVVGGIFSQVFNDGSLSSPLRGVQTVNVPVGGGAIFETRLREPGEYPFVTHAFDDATKGAVGVFRALAPNQTALGGPAAMRH